MDSGYSMSNTQLSSTAMELIDVLGLQTLIVIEWMELYTEEDMRSIALLSQW